MDFKQIGVLSVGGIFGYKYSYWKLNDSKWSWNSYIIAARGKMHLTNLKIKNFDFYGGLSLGIRITKGKLPDNRYALTLLNNDTKPLFGIFGGAQYNFNKQFGVYSELGFDLAYLTIGIDYKF